MTFFLRLFLFRFIRSVLNVTKAFHLDGFDVDWEFPAWLGAVDREKIYFVQLLQELRKEFDRSGRRLILTVAVAAPQAIVDQSYYVPEMAEYVPRSRKSCRDRPSRPLPSRIANHVSGTSTS